MTLRMQRRTAGFVRRLKLAAVAGSVALFGALFGVVAARTSASAIGAQSEAATTATPAAIRASTGRGGFIGSSASAPAPVPIRIHARTRAS